MKKKMAFLFVLSAFASSFCFSAFAKEYIAPVEVNVIYDKNMSTLDALSVSGPYYTCEKRVYLEPGKRVQLFLRADNDNTFAITKASEVVISGAKYVAAKKRDFSTLLALTVDLPDDYPWLIDHSGWIGDDHGFKFLSDSGVYLCDGWQEIGGKYYYFGSDGYVLLDSRTPDGYAVDCSGEWDGASALISVGS